MLPSWARRIRSLREARGWTQSDAATRLRDHTGERMLGDLGRQWQSWELAENKPDAFHQSIIAATLGTATAALFPPDNRPGVEALAAVAPETVDLRGMDDATLAAVRRTVEKLCSDYARRSPTDLIADSRQWLRRLLAAGGGREVSEQAGWLALLVGCLEYDLGNHHEADRLRLRALALGQESSSAGVLGWAHEMRAWFALTRGDHRGAIAAAKAGQAVAGTHSVSVQLAAQEAKAWARMGRLPEVEAALDRGRTLLDALPYPGNIDNHFVVDPSKYDFYAMDCYRHLGDDDRARELSTEVIRASADPGHGQRWPMRVAEARITLGVAAVRQGDLDEALAQGRQALAGERKSLPSLALVARDLTAVLEHRYPTEPEARAYLDELRTIRR